MTVVVDVKELVVAFEGGKCSLLVTQVGVEQGESFVDVVVGESDDAFFVVDGIVVVNFDDLVDDVGGTERGEVAQGEVDNGVVVIVANYRHGMAVVFGHINGVGVDNINRNIIEIGGVKPGLIDDYATGSCGNSVVERGYNGFVFAILNANLFVVDRSDFDGDIVVVVVVDEVDFDGGFAVEVFFPFDESCGGGVGDVEFEVLDHAEHGCFGGEYHHLVVDGAVVEGLVCEHPFHRGFSKGVVTVVGVATQNDFRRAFIDAVLAVDIKESNCGANGSAEYEPMKVAKDGEKDVLDMEFGPFGFFQEGKVGLFGVLSHCDGIEIIGLNVETV